MLLPSGWNKPHERLFFQFQVPLFLLLSISLEEDEVCQLHMTACINIEYMRRRSLRSVMNIINIPLVSVCQASPVDSCIQDPPKQSLIYTSPIF